ncbi:MAG: glycosyltransferase [Legionellales bacterium]|jgi:glycosyltransferase involved in cell wall biosynthesis
MKTVAVMLCTYNGEQFLDAQLESLAQQTQPDLVVYVSDDGSSDATLKIIKQSMHKYPHLNIQFLESSQRDSRKGFQYNFLSIFNLSNPPARYIAYVDQDDIWEKDKLACALKWLETLPPQTPGLYGGRTRLINEHDQDMGFSPLYTKRPSFSNALVQNIFGGNTMVMNLSAWYLMKSAYGPDIISHDWWTYQVIAGAEGEIFYDPKPKVRYRQHASNVVGSNKSLQQNWSRFKRVWRGQFSRFNETNLAALSAVKFLLSPTNQQQLQSFIQAREAGRPALLRYLFAGNIYRQTCLGQIALFIAIVLRKF